MYNPTVEVEAERVSGRGVGQQGRASTERERERSSLVGRGRATDLGLGWPSEMHNQLSSLLRPLPCLLPCLLLWLLPWLPGDLGVEQATCTSTSPSQGPACKSFFKLICYQQQSRKSNQAAHFLLRLSVGRFLPCPSLPPPPHTPLLPPVRPPPPRLVTRYRATSCLCGRSVQAAYGWGQWRTRESSSSVAE